MGRHHPQIPKPFLIWMVRWAKGFQLKPDHSQLCYRKLYIYELWVYCTFMREFTSGHGLICTVMVMLGSQYPLQCFASCFDFLTHLDLPKFYSRSATCIRLPKFLLDLPSWWFTKVCSLMQYFCWFAKVLHRQHSHYKVITVAHAVTLTPVIIIYAAKIIQQICCTRKYS